MRVLGALALGAAVFAVIVPEVRPQTDASAREEEFQKQVRPVLKQYCTGCHNARMKTAGVAVDALTSAESLETDGATWEKILRKVRTGEMPPTGLPHPAQPARDAFVNWTGAELDRIAAAHPDPGRVTAHRLNRAEYNNAVRDLLHVDFRPADDFPADDSGYGFDNIADVLSVPPVLMEKYLSAAGKVSRAALGHVRFDPVLDRFSAPRAVPQNQRLSDVAPVASRGGFEMEHRFPVEADYLFRVRLRGTPDASAPETLDIRLDGKPLKREQILIGTEEENEEQRRLEWKMPVGEGPHTLMVTFLRDDSKSESPHVERGPDGKVRRARLAVDWIEIGGPFDVRGVERIESRRRLLTCVPSSTAAEEPCAREILTRVARRAWRRPVTPAETERLLGFFRAGREDSKQFEGGIELALKAILVSPNFLFRVEHESAGVVPGSVYPLSDLDLASRLAFWLWSSIPDEELLATAERGELSQPDVFNREIRRMLHDPRARALTANFAGQWLHLRNLSSIKPDPDLFPEFDDDLRAAMQREAELFFESMLREDRSVLDFLDARFTFVNDRLAKFYGIPDIEGRQFRRIDLTDGKRGGIMTMAAVLAVTSYPTRTSPVIRGKWVLENLLGAPPPPPPPDVPPLKETGLGKTVSMRQQLEAHRANPACAGCHAKMDPIGFSLENYDPVGRWRTRDGAFDVDTAGRFPSGETFRNAAELKTLLRSQPEEFVLCLTEKLMTYALGRGLERADKPVVRSIVRQAAKDDYRMSSILFGIANSLPFRMRRAADATTKNDKGRNVLRAGN